MKTTCLILRLYRLPGTDSHNDTGASRSLFTLYPLEPYLHKKYKFDRASE